MNTSKQEKECAICLCEEVNLIYCYNSIPKYCNTNCETGICFNCFPILLKHSLSENLLPTCPTNGCKKIYPLSEVKKLGSDVIDIIYECIYKYIRKNDGESVNKDIEYDNLILKMRNERSTFIKDYFPKAIQLTSNIVFKSKLQKLNKDKILKLNERVKNMKIMCYNISCNGFLEKKEKEYLCTSCDTKFCIDCEKTMKDFHKCKPDDIESVKFVQTLVKCPNCNFSVQKSEGCNDMTCSNCKTNFDYSSGEKGGGGNHGKNGDVDIRKNYKLSQEYNTLVKDILELLIKIELNEPKSASETSYKNTLKLIIKNGEDKDLKIKLARQYIYYLQLKYASKKYAIIMANIEQLCIKKQINVEYLESFLNKLN